MRKRIVSSPQDTPPTDDWLDLESLAEVEFTSEDPTCPIESALLPGGGPGWRAADAGSQVIRLLFNPPQAVHRIWLQFREDAAERSQEYVLRWSSDGGREFAEIVRQQWNFSPGGSTEQVEDHRVELPNVDVLELEITPDRDGGASRASLQQLRLA